MFADGFFNAPWWQGVAGIAQIVAAIFAIITIIQARKTIKQAEGERRLSVAPDWDVVNAGIGGHRGGHNTDRLGLVFTNTGFGPARSVVVWYEPRNETKPTCMLEKDLATISPLRVVPPMSRMRVHLEWPAGKLLDGLLFVECTTRLGDRMKHEFHVRTYLGEDGAMQPDVKPVYAD